MRYTNPGLLYSTDGRASCDSIVRAMHVCALYIRPRLTTLRTNRDGSWLRCYSRNAQNWYCVTNFLTQPVERRDVVGDTPIYLRQVERGGTRIFS